MITTHDFLLRARIDAATLDAWVETGWVRAPAQGGPERFADVDLARARLIRDLQLDIGVNAEGIAIILDLVDQVHGLRQTLGELLAAIYARSEVIRRRVTAEPLEVAVDPSRHVSGPGTGPAGTPP